MAYSDACAECAVKPMIDKYKEGHLQASSQNHSSDFRHQHQCKWQQDSAMMWAGQVPKNSIQSGVSCRKGQTFQNNMLTWYVPQLHYIMSSPFAGDNKQLPPLERIISWWRLKLISHPRGMTAIYIVILRSIDLSNQCQGNQVPLRHYWHFAIHKSGAWVTYARKMDQSVLRCFRHVCRQNIFL